MNEIGQTKRFFDIVVIIPLREELDAFLTIFPVKETLVTDFQFRAAVVVPNDAISMLVIQQEGMGRRHASIATERAIAEFNVGVFVCLGIAGAISNDVNLTDVCYVDTVIDVYDNAKVSTTKQGKMKVSFSPENYDIDRRYIAAFEYNHSVPEIKNRYEEWKAERARVAEKVVPDAVPGRTAPEFLRSPNCMSGAVACASVTDNPEYNLALKGPDRKVLAVETEAGGVFDVATRSGIPAIEIRGISDYADKGKSDLEGATKGLVRGLAASNAVTFFELQLRNPFFLKAISVRRSNCSQTPLAAFRHATQPTISLGEVLERITTAIDSQLRELSPQYRAHLKGYRLPVPRIKRVDVEIGTAEGTTAKPIEIIDALVNRKNIYVQLDRTFPDRSLAWVLSDDLLTRSIGGDQCLPVVIDAQSFVPRGTSLLDLASFDTQGMAALPSKRLVFIIEDLPLWSKRKVDFILAALEAEPDSKAVFISRETHEALDRSEFMRRAGADSFRVLSTSFFELSHFVQRNFGTSASEAETIAYRMDRTFRRFRLSAHPTYFAGLQKDALINLLEVNRRAELIQLAVDGYLAQIVRSEGGNLALGRRARIRFLGMVAMKSNVNGELLDQQYMLRLAREFMQENDFAIDPLAFVQSFETHGIFAYDKGSYSFALVFVEAYVLALALIANENIAFEYFRTFDNNIKTLAFDLYSELGPSQRIVTDVQENMALCIDVFALPSGEQHVLMTNEVRPALADKTGRLQAVRSQLDKISSDVQNGSETRGSKQRDIDLLDEVRSAVSKRNPNAITLKSPSPKNDEGSESAFALQAWHTGAILLGSGAEHLNGTVKQGLATSLVQLGSLIIHHWTKQTLSLDISALKDELLNSAEIKKLREEDIAEGGTEERVQNLVKGIVDFVEITLLGLPFYHITSQLCEQARSAILSTSVDKISMPGTFDQLFRSIWLTEVDSKVGRIKFDEIISKVPSLVFLRTSVASHFLMRIYWSHGKFDDRTRLLQAADLALRPLTTVGVDKGRIERELKRLQEAETEEEQEHGYR